MIKPGIKSTEFYTIASACLVTAMQILGIDVQVLLAQIQGEEFGAVLEMVKEAHKQGGWQSIAAMWAGVGLYSWLRTNTKTKESNQLGG